MRNFRLYHVQDRSLCSWTISVIKRAFSEEISESVSRLVSLRPPPCRTYSRVEILLLNVYEEAMRHRPQLTRGRSEMKLLGVVLALGFAGFILGQHFHRYFVSGNIGNGLESCPPCACDCFLHDQLQSMGVTGVRHSQALLPHCNEHIVSADMLDEVELQKYRVFRDAVDLQERKTEEAEEQSQTALLHAQTLQSQYRHELGKCVGGMLTAENARVEVEAAVKVEKDTSSLWESRARALGWKDEHEREKHISDHSEI